MLKVAHVAATDGDTETRRHGDAETRWFRKVQPLSTALIRVIEQPMDTSSAQFAHPAILNAHRINYSGQDYHGR